MNGKIYRFFDLRIYSMWNIQYCFLSHICVRDTYSPPPPERKKISQEFDLSQFSQHMQKQIHNKIIIFPTTVTQYI